MCRSLDPNNAQRGYKPATLTLTPSNSNEIIVEKMLGTTQVTTQRCSLEDAFKEIEWLALHHQMVQGELRTYEANDFYLITPSGCRPLESLDLAAIHQLRREIGQSMGTVVSWMGCENEPFQTDRLVIERRGSGFRVGFDFFLASGMPFRLSRCYSDLRDLTTSCSLSPFVEGKQTKIGNGGLKISFQGLWLRAEQETPVHLPDQPLGKQLANNTSQVDRILLLDCQKGFAEVALLTGSYYRGSERCSTAFIQFLAQQNTDNTVLHLDSRRSPGTTYILAPSCRLWSISDKGWAPLNDFSVEACNALYKTHRTQEGTIVHTVDTLIFEKVNHGLIEVTLGCNGLEIGKVCSPLEALSKWLKGQTAQLNASQRGQNLLVRLRDLESLSLWYEGQVFTHSGWFRKIFQQLSHYNMNFPLGSFENPHPVDWYTIERVPGDRNYRTLTFYYEGRALARCSMPLSEYMEYLKQEDWYFVETSQGEHLRVQLNTCPSEWHAAQ